MDQQTETNALAKTSLVVGILSAGGLALVNCCGFLIGVLAVVVGLMALRQIANSHGMETGKRAALTGILFGAFAIVSGCVLSIIFMEHDGPGIVTLFGLTR